MARLVAHTREEHRKPGTRLRLSPKDNGKQGRGSGILDERLFHKARGGPRGRDASRQSGLAILGKGDLQQETEELWMTRGDGRHLGRLPGWEVGPSSRPKKAGEDADLGRKVSQTADHSGSRPRCFPKRVGLLRVSGR